MCVYLGLYGLGCLSLQVGTCNFKTLPLLKPTPGGLGLCRVRMSGGRCSWGSEEAPSSWKLPDSGVGEFCTETSQAKPWLGECPCGCTHTHHPALPTGHVLRNGVPSPSPRLVFLSVTQKRSPPAAWKGVALQADPVKGKPFASGTSACTRQQEGRPGRRKAATPHSCRGR